jgi:hypothetical protein
VLKNNMLFQYRDSDALMPVEVIFIECCYVDKVTDYIFSTKFGFRVSHSSEKFKEIVLYCDSVAERDAWVLRLRQAAQSRNINEYYKIYGRIGNGKFSTVHM